MSNRLSGSGKARSKRGRRDLQKTFHAPRAKARTVASHSSAADLEKEEHPGGRSGKTSSKPICFTDSRHCDSNCPRLHVMKRDAPFRIFIVGSNVHGCPKRDSTPPAPNPLLSIAESDCVPHADAAPNSRPHPCDCSVLLPRGERCGRMIETRDFRGALAIRAASTLIPHISLGSGNS
jgi:hypothetical protein